MMIIIGVIAFIVFVVIVILIFNGLKVFSKEDLKIMVVFIISKFLLGV